MKGRNNNTGRMIGAVFLALVSIVLIVSLSNLGGAITPPTPDNGNDNGNDNDEETPPVLRDPINDLSGMFWQFEDPTGTYNISNSEDFYHDSHGNPIFEFTVMWENEYEGDLYVDGTTGPWVPPVWGWPENTTKILSSRGTPSTINEEVTYIVKISLNGKDGPFPTNPGQGQRLALKPWGIPFEGYGWPTPPAGLYTPRDAEFIHNNFAPWPTYTFEVTVSNEPHNKGHFKIETYGPMTEITQPNIQTYNWSAINKITIQFIEVGT